MSLRYQINLGILSTLLIVLLLANGAIILQARQSVAEEVQASINLAVQLLKLGINQSEHDSLTNESNLQNILLLKQTRHLEIELFLDSGKHLQLTDNPAPIQHNAPSWFVWAISIPYLKHTYPVLTQDKKTINIIITANALDEINEAWQEAQTFFGIILLLNLGLFITVNLVFRRVLKTVAVILQGLKEIEAKNYQTQLPHFKTTEFNQIAAAINHLNASLAKSKQENAELTQHSLEIQESERQRLAQELHDELGQSLTAIKVMAVASKKDDARQVEIYQSIVSICDHLFTVVRSMMKTLHPLMLRELGLSAALEDLVHHWQIRTPVFNIRINCQKTVDRLDAKIAIQIFRIIQECITNTVRHANAKEMNINISANPTEQKNSIKITINDDGIGCEPQSLQQGFGLLGMQARINSLKGSLQITTAHNQGMSIKIYIPVQLQTDHSAIQIIHDDGKHKSSFS
ncbi:MAG: histidine kinase [Methylococcaceae bacterium]|nr:histidine kinase [Methylococcaceae bacterium]